MSHWQEGCVCSSSIAMREGKGEKRLHVVCWWSRFRIFGSKQRCAYTQYSCIDLVTRARAGSKVVITLCLGWRVCAYCLISLEWLWWGLSPSSFMCRIWRLLCRSIGMPWGQDRGRRRPSEWRIQRSLPSHYHPYRGTALRTCSSAARSQCNFLTDGQLRQVRQCMQVSTPTGQDSHPVSITTERTHREKHATKQRCKSSTSKMPKQRVAKPPTGKASPTINIIAVFTTSWWGTSQGLDLPDYEEASRHAAARD